MQYSTSDPSTQIPWFATSHGHIDLGTSKDFRERKKQEKKDEPTVMKEETPRAESDKSVDMNKASAGSVSKRKESTNSHKVGVGGLPPLVKKPGRQVTEPPKEFPTKLATISQKDLAPISPPEKSSGKVVKVRYELFSLFMRTLHIKCFDTINIFEFCCPVKVNPIQFGKTESDPKE